ncbi:MAG: aminotransferase class V-fold PLP-dependent enzyme [Methanomicrobiales archaeon]|nr:aminotransferase class V-fold PLP-dependent enzyme [Methanomicrobiales archaeon]MDD1658132.1 aminotransferase class V-fold PLP-dependent enzyme [Methanomicrobiales archaeon]
MEEEFIYLNNAATSWPKPPGVLAAVQESLSRPFAGEGRGTGGQGVDYPARAREALAGFFRGEPVEHLAFSQNATDALNTLIHGFLATEGDGFHVLTTALEHNSVLRPLSELAGQERITLEILPFSGTRIDPGAVRDAVRPETRLAVMTHGSNVLGSVQDIRTIGAHLQERGVYFIVDGAQTAGHVPVDLSGLPVDAWVFTGHKGLFGLPGTGGFFLRDPERIAPVRTGGTGTDSGSLLHPRRMPERFEIGTPNYPGLASLAAGVAFIGSVGPAAIARKAERQTRSLVRELRGEPNIILYNEEPDLPIISFNIRGLDCDDAGFILARRHRIVVRTGLHCAPLVHRAMDGGKGCVRLSLSWFTTDEQCRIAADAVREIARHADSPVRPP